jgi:UDP-N-acetyl-D-mannosaminuronic acid dehydrogenase
MVIGTPVDEHLNPKYNEIIRAIDRMVDYLRDGQVFILRSTVFPGISDHIQHLFKKRGWQIDVSYCPERVAQGYSLREIKELPQIISAFNPSALERVQTLFQKICPEIIVLNPIEAELTKLMTNAWRYIQFATVNQFYTLATENGVDFDKILHACRHHYPRMANLPGPGFTAGPCLVKDTMQLAAYSQNSFILGHSAMLVNEGLPLFIVSQAEKEIDLIKSTAGILGMAFKAESDDHRESLSYKLKKLLRLKCKQVLCSDPYVKDDRLISMRELIEKSDVIFIGAPHKIYRNIEIPEGKILFDIWKCVNKN